MKLSISENIASNTAKNDYIKRANSLLTTQKKQLNNKNFLYKQKN